MILPPQSYEGCTIVAPSCTNSVAPTQWYTLLGNILIKMNMKVNTARAASTMKTLSMNPVKATLTVVLILSTSCSVFVKLSACEDYS